jgi:Cd2+/Zn2+-exporting ATPase
LRGVQASAGMSSLMGMLPVKAVIATTGEVVSVRDVRVGDVVAVRAGEIVPVDGVVVDGQSEVDERSLTGESFPVPKQPHSEVWAGTMNFDGKQTNNQKNLSSLSFRVPKCTEL